MLAKLTFSVVALLVFATSASAKRPQAPLQSARVVLGIKHSRGSLTSPLWLKAPSMKSRIAAPFKKAWGAIKRPGPDSYVGEVLSHVGMWVGAPLAGAGATLATGNVAAGIAAGSTVFTISAIGAHKFKQ
jgi:hypothetical protein